MADSAGGAKEETAASLAMDDETDADFFDRLMDDDDDFIPAPVPVPVKEELAAPGVDTLVRGVSTGSLFGDEPGPSSAEGESPEGSENFAGAQAAVNQAQWADGEDGFHPFGRLPGGGAGEVFLRGAVQSNWRLGSSVAAIVGESPPDDGFFSRSQSMAAEVKDQDFSDWSPNCDSNQQLEQSGSGAVNYTDPKHLENMYPGWKYDEATQQWYSVDSFDWRLKDAALVHNPSENVEQQQQQFGEYSLQDSLQPAVETTAEEGATTATSYGQGATAPGYPPNMLFFVEFPDWYFDTNLQQWQSLDSYQQAIKQVGAASVVQDGANLGVAASSIKYDFKHTEGIAVDNQAPEHNYFNNTYSHQNQWQTDAVCNHIQPESATDSMEGSFHGSDQHLNAESFSSSTDAFGNKRSSAGRPPHALVAFGFGGKVIVMKETSSMASDFNSGIQGNSSGTLSVLNLSEVVAQKADASSATSGSAPSYFHALCRQSVPGPLVGGSAASKDVNKWLDEMIACYASSTSEFERDGPRKLLISLLKILCQYYGKLRAPFGSDPSQQNADGPEMAVTKLLSSCKRSSVRMGDIAANANFMKNIPSESQLQAVAKEVQTLLVSGRRKEALLCAQEGQLWGPAVILALQLGDKFYVDTVRKMAHCHFISGSPLRTLCLLIAGQPADVFNVENNNCGTVGAYQQHVEPSHNAILDHWDENLAIITANRTKGDDLVITQLGDCLWRERNEVAAAHSCYLVAELNIEPYSENTRLCLIGADHLKCPRTFASPEAIQRTEVYEYTKVLGNSQYVMLPFQPYKLIYAYMLVEVGRVSDSLRYCQASMKVLKASGHSPELETWKQLFSSLEERIRFHKQSGYGTNLAPTRLVGKVFSSHDKSLSRMMGTPSAPLPPLPQGSLGDRQIHSTPTAATFANSQSVMTMSSSVPSTSVQSINEMDAPLPPLPQGSLRDKQIHSTPTAATFANSPSVMTMSSSVPSTSVQSINEMAELAHTRSASEPDFNRPANQGAGAERTQNGSSGSGNSRLGWLGSTLQKTMGFVSKNRQAKLGEPNKFYYDEKLKRWVEEGAEIPAEEPPAPPPPIRSSLQNCMPDYNLNGRTGVNHAPSGVTEQRSPEHSDHGSGMPPIPPSQNQFAARGRLGARSRYVDTFNKAGATGAQSYNRPAALPVAPPAGAKFFVPTAAALTAEQMRFQPAEAVPSFSSPPPAAQYSAPMTSPSIN